jgi:hypothetical protein
MTAKSFITLATGCLRLQGCHNIQHSDTDQSDIQKNAAVQVGYRWHLVVVQGIFLINP